MGYNAKSPDFSRDPAKDRNGLTPGQKEFADKVLEVGKVEAARLAFPQDKYPNERANELLRNPNVASTISKKAELLGLTRESCLEAIKRGLEAKKQVPDGKFKMREVDDNSSQLKAAELGLKVHGELKEDKGVSVNFFGKEAYAEFCDEFYRRGAIEGEAA